MEISQKRMRILIGPIGIELSYMYIIYQLFKEIENFGFILNSNSEDELNAVN